MDEATTQLRRVDFRASHLDTEFEPQLIRRYDCWLFQLVSTPLERKRHPGRRSDDDDAKR